MIVNSLRADLTGMAKSSAVSPTGAGPITITRIKNGRARTKTVAVTPTVTKLPHSHNLHQGTHRQAKKANDYGRTMQYAIGRGVDTVREPK